MASEETTPPRIATALARMRLSTRPLTLLSPSFSAHTGRGGRGPRRGLLAGCMGGEAPSYGGTDVAVAVDALARTASTLQADLRSERRANEAFREGVTREQRRMRKHLEGLPLGDAELAEEGARASYAAGAGRRHENGASSFSSWSVTRGTSFALTLMTVAVVVLVAYAAATGGGSRGLAGGVAALKEYRARADKDTAGSARRPDVPTRAPTRAGRRGAARAKRRDAEAAETHVARPRDASFR